MGLEQMSLISHFICQTYLVTHFGPKICFSIIKLVCKIINIKIVRDARAILTHSETTMTMPHIFIVF